jgi:WD40 repeat protein
MSAFGWTRPGIAPLYAPVAVVECMAESRPSFSHSIAVRAARAAPYSYAHSSHIAPDHLSRHTHPVYSLAWSPNGQYLSSGGKDSTVQVWEALAGAS